MVGLWYLENVGEEYNMKANVGDEVTVKGVVESDDPILCIKFRRHKAYVLEEDIVSISPKSFVAGDKVTYYGNCATILAIDDDAAWIKYDQGGGHLTIELRFLKRRQT